MEKNEDSMREHYFDLIIEKCLDRLDILLAMYPDEMYARQLADIRRRYSDPELKLAVIGEFNTGKSTFLNALIGQAYLSMDNVPTTVIPTYLRWNGEPGMPPSIKVKLADDSREYDVIEHRSLLEEKLGVSLDQSGSLEAITANNRFIGVVSYVAVSFPANGRFADFCLIDTPGTNPGAEETREHASITRAVLREEADATIILFPAIAAGNRSALEFISENASHLLDGAAFVITKTDILDSEKELEKISKYLKGLVKQKYNLDDQTIYTCSAKRALKASEAGDNSDPYLIQFHVMIREILESLGHRRKQLIFHKVSALLNAVLGDLRKKQILLSGKLEQDKQVLETYSLENLDREYRLLYRGLEKELNSSYPKKIAQVRKKISDQQEFILSFIRRDLEGIQKLLELREYTDVPLKLRLSILEDCIREKIKEDLTEMDSLYKAYSQMVYARLKKYQLEISAPIVGQTSEVSPEKCTREPKDAFVLSALDVIDGLGIGTLLLFFVNPLAVITVGFLFRDLLIKKIKKSVLENIESGLENTSIEIEKKWKTAILEVRSRYLASGISLMDEYKERYAGIFREREAEYRKRQQSIEDELFRVNHSLREIDWMEYALEIPAKPDFYPDIPQELLSKARSGDAVAANEIAGIYQRRYQADSSEENRREFLRWTAFSFLFGGELG